MIQIIYGKKGSGKTKRILDMANQMTETRGGDVVFIDDDNSYMFDLRHEVRFVNAGEYNMRNADMFYGFLSGMLAQNFDVKVILIDAFLKLTKSDVNEMGWFFERLNAVSTDRDIDFILSVSLDAENIPEFMKPYLI
ncbi:MAG: ATP-binding protein [Clostridia bacterium]|nr:ATP-binding protein [Clostridia bacterium]